LLAAVRQNSGMPAWLTTLPLITGFANTIAEPGSARQKIRITNNLYAHPRFAHKTLQAA
jgi:hypothetical protein